MSKSNRPLSRKQQRAMQELLKAAETARFEVINHTGKNRDQGAEND